MKRQSFAWLCTPRLRGSTRAGSHSAEQVVGMLGGNSYGATASPAGVHSHAGRPSKKPGLSACFAALLCLLWAAACAAPSAPRRAYFPFGKLSGQAFSAPQVQADAVRETFGEDPNAVLLAIDEDSSFRAVTSAVQRLREKRLAVGYWIDVRCGPGADDGFEARLARARRVLADRPPCDAIFVAGLEGERLPCGCFEATCAASADAPPVQSTVRFLAALRSLPAGPILVPVWPDESGPGAATCSDPGCLAAHCAERSTQVWSALLADSPRMALVFGPQAPGDPAVRVGERLRLWSRLRGSSPTGQGGVGATIVTVLPGLNWSGDQLAAAVAAVRGSDRGGFVVLHCATRRSERPAPVR